jgi:autophagy-related protein 9
MDISPKNLYYYYLNGGYTSWLVDKISKLFVIESIATTYFFFTCIFDWSTGLIAWNPHALGIFVSSFVALQGVIYFVMFLKDYRAMHEAKVLYHRIGITDEMIAYIQWKDIAYKLVEAGIIDNELLIQCSVVRETNFIMGLMEHKLLVGESFMSEWYAYILGMTIQKYLDSRTNYGKICLAYGVGAAIIVPYMLLYHVTYTLIKYAVAIYKEPSSLFELKWSVRSMYKFRYYNELPHEIESRMRNAAILADKYNSLFPSNIRSKVAERLAFVVSEAIIIMVVMLYVSPYANSHVFLKVLTTAMLLWTVTQSLITPKGNKPNPLEVTHDLRNVLMTETMFNDLPNKLDHDRLNKLYTYRLWYGLNEILGIILTPIFLIYMAFHREHVIATYFDHNTKIHDTIGVIFKGSEFNKQELEEPTASKLMRSYHYFEQQYSMSQSIAYSKMLDTRFVEE